MNFSPDNRATLETLLASLGAGVSGEQAAPILAATLQAQQAQQAERTARYQDMASNVTSLAGQGMTYGSTGNYIDAMTQKPGIPGRFQELLDSTYANPDVPEQFQPGGAQYVSPGGTSDDGTPYAPQIQNQLQSPLFTQNPASTGAYNQNVVTDDSGATMQGPNFGNLMPASGQARYAATQEMLGSMPQPAEPSDADQMGAVNAQINSMKAAQMAPEEIARRISTNPEVQGIIMENLNEFASLQPDIVGLMAPGMGI